MTDYSEDSLSAMTYREIQAIAKTMGIPANKKKDEIITLIMKSLPTSAEQPSDVTTNEEKVHIIESVAVAEPIQCAETPAKKSKGIASTARPATAAKTPHPAVHTPAPVTEEKAPFNEESDEIEDAEDDTEVAHIVKSFSNIVRLKGLPMPQGTKTIFNAETPVINSTGCVRGLIFDSPAGKKTSKENNVFQTPCRDDCENSDPQYYEDEGSSHDGKPRNNHTHFFSPEMKIGSQVHWRYEDYDLKAQTSVPPVPPGTARKVTSTLKTPATNGKIVKSCKKTPGNGILVNAAVPDIDPTASPQTRQDNLMSFWLSKGTPGKALFH